MTSLLIWTAVALGFQAAAPPADPLATQVAALVRELDARELGQRDVAERRLLDLGGKILPLLPAVDERTPAEIALRVGRVQQKLLRAQALAGLKPAPVTLKRTEMPLSEVLKEITRQTGNPITDHREVFGEQRTEQAIHADFDQTPFWRALDNVLDQAGLTLYGFAGQRGAFVVSRPPGAAARGVKACYAGLFRLEPLRFEAVRDLRNDEMRSLKLSMEVAWEPRLQPIAILQPRAAVQAVGNNGEAVRVAGPEAEPEVLIRAGTSSAELEIPLLLPDRGMQTIRQLKGTLVVLVPGPLESFRFADVPLGARQPTARRLEQRKAGTVVVLDHVRKNNAAWEVGLRVKFEAPPTALESHRSWILENDAYLERADQGRIEPGGIEQTSQNKDEIGIHYFFRLDDEPDKLTFVYRTPIMVLELPVEYEFHDLRLP